MPQRQGYQGGGAGQRAAYGAFTGLADAMEMLLGQRMKDVGVQRQEEKEADIAAGKEVEAGKATPEEEAARMQVRFPHPRLTKAYGAERYQPFYPSETARAIPASNEIAKAPNLQEVPTLERLRALLEEGHVPTEGTPFIGREGAGSQFLAPGGAAEDVTPASPAMANLNAQRMAKLASFPPATMEGINPETLAMTKTEVPQGYQARMGIEQPQQLSPEQAGQREVREAGGKGEAQRKVEEIVGPQKAITAGLETKARMAQEYSPEMLQLRAKQRAMEEAATLDMQARRVDYRTGRAETNTGLPYLDLDRWQGMDQRFAAEAGAKAGLPVLRTPEVGLMQQSDQVLTQLDEVAKLIPKLPKNILGLPVVEAQRRAQTDPQLAGVLSALQPAALGTARVMAGTTGFRSNRIEMERAIDAYLTSTTAETKIVQLSTIRRILLQEQALHLIPNAADRATWLRDKLTPTPTR